MGNKGKSGGGAGWVWIPISSLGGGKGGGGKGKGGKGKRRNIGMVRRAGKTMPEKLAWFGGLAEKDAKDKEMNKKLQAWINKLCSGCKFVDIGPKGSGGAIFGSEEEASNAIATLNGKKFQGKAMEWDVWVQGFTGD